MLRRFIAFIGVCVLSFSAFADSWRVGAPPANASASSAALVTNDAGDTLYLWRQAPSQRYEIFAELHLGTGKAFSHRLPKYQIDQGKITRIDRIGGSTGTSVEGWASVSDRRAIWKLRDSDDRILSEGEGLYSWISGDRIRFVYFDDVGREITTEFSLSGSSLSITKIAGVQIK